MGLVPSSAGVDINQDSTGAAINEGVGSANRRRAEAG